MLITEDKTSEHVNKRCGYQPKEDFLSSRVIPKDQPLISPLKEPTVTQTSRTLASLVLESEQLSKAPLYDDAEIDHDKTDTFKPWSTPYSDTDILPSYTSQVMRTYNLDYVLSVRNLLIYLVMRFLRNLLIYHHLI